MLSFIRAGLFAFIAAILVACGGGGGGGDNAPNFAGNYLVNTTLSSNNCNAAVANTFTFSDSVTQNGRSITVGQEGDNFLGSVDADNGGFSASFTEIEQGITVVGVIAFRTITAGSTYAASVSVTAGPCAAIYNGTATKI